MSITFTTAPTFSATLHVFLLESTFNVGSGLVGIGTTNPGLPLEISINDASAYSGGAPGNALRLRNNTVASDSSYIGLELYAGKQEPTGKIPLSRIYCVKEDTTTTAGALIFSTRKSDSMVYERMCIDSEGNVGIGTSNPQVPLEIKGKRPAIRLNDDNPTGQSNFEIVNNGGTLGIFDVTNIGLGNLLTINGGGLAAGAGNVGIGTTNPAEKLTVIGDILIDNNTDSTLYLGKGAEGVDGVTKIKCTQTGTDTDELGLSFFVHGSSAGTTVPSEAMSITHAGNVGIGTTDPSGPLHTWDTTIDQIHLTRAMGSTYEVLTV